MFGGVVCLFVVVFVGVWGWLLVMFGGGGELTRRVECLKTLDKSRTNRRNKS